MRVREVRGDKEKKRKIEAARVRKIGGRERQVVEITSSTLCKNLVVFVTALQCNDVIWNCGGAAAKWIEYNSITTEGCLACEIVFIILSQLNSVEMYNWISRCVENSLAAIKKSSSEVAHEGICHDENATNQKAISLSIVCDLWYKYLFVFSVSSTNRRSNRRPAICPKQWKAKWIWSQFVSILGEYAWNHLKYLS